MAYFLLLDSQEKQGPNEYLEGQFNDLVGSPLHVHVSGLKIPYRSF